MNEKEDSWSKLLIFHVRWPDIPCQEWPDILCQEMTSWYSLSGDDLLTFHVRRLPDIPCQMTWYSLSGDDLLTFHVRRWPDIPCQEMTWYSMSGDLIFLVRGWPPNIPCQEMTWYSMSDDLIFYVRGWSDIPCQGMAWYSMSGDDLIFHVRGMTWYSTSGDDLLIFHSGDDLIFHQKMTSSMSDDLLIFNVRRWTDIPCQEMTFLHKAWVNTGKTKTELECNRTATCPRRNTLNSNRLHQVALTRLVSKHN